ncbi:MAG: carbohydrate-binding domain-containing protein [Muribaculaceae bacterium]|nr:carbohydrate-binding domain-containing protein [Muribaculaceae bacterium]
MKYFISLYLMAAMPVMVAGQSINFSNGQTTINYSAEEVGEIIFNNSSVTIGQTVMDLNEWSRISVDETVVEANTVQIEYNGAKANVLIPGNLHPFVEVAVDGAHVQITQSAEVSDTTCGEISYSLSGTSNDGSLTLTGSYKCTIELRGLELTNPSGAALDIQNGKRIAISVKNGTVNTLVDGNGSQKGAVTCKGHLEFKGKGQLSVTGTKSHAIYAKEYVEIKNLTLDILGSVKDGINCAQYMSMHSGELNLTNIGDDGIQVSYKDETDREAEDTGSITIDGGKITIHVSADAVKCIKADADVTINGGTLTLSTSSNGIYDTTKAKTKSSACIGADGDIVINDGTLTLSATGSGGKGISCDGVFTCNGGKLNIATTGGMLVYTNGSLNHNYTGNVDRITSDNKSSSKGIKADSGVIINGGDMYITTATNNAEGIESKKDMDIKGGTIFVKAYDDGINSSDDFRVSGGDLTVISIVGDGLDSNGNLTISGGTVRTMGSGGMEMGLDAATESGCAVYITGGSVMAFGGSNTYPTKTGSTQPFVNISTSIKSDTEISILSGGETLATFVVPSEYNENTGGLFRPGGWGPGGNSGSGSLLLSTPDLVSGATYTINNAGTSSNATAKLTSR